jgi:hypothetical protein
VVNLYDLTGGSYSVRRTVSYPQFPRSVLLFVTDVRAVGASEWETTIRVSGTYEGPTDVVGVRDYQLVWTAAGDTLVEKGTATLVLSSGGWVRSEWSSTIVPRGRGLRGFPRAGEIVKASISPFRIDGDRMSYKWEGTVGLLGK